MGPNERGWLEQAASALAGSRLIGSQILHVAVTLVGHVRTIAQQSAVIGSGSPEHTMDEAIRAVLTGREEQFPALGAALGDRTGKDQTLEFGLQRIRDGVQLLIDRFS